MTYATFHFHGPANDFLPEDRQESPFRHHFDWKASIKDMLEALGPPHTEIEAITVDGRPVDFDYIVEPGTMIDIYSRIADAPGDDNILLTPPPPMPHRFILDTHLGRLANYLRMTGFDTLYRNDYPDDELAAISHPEGRILLTRDIGVLKRGIVTFGHYMRATDPRKQIIEIIERYDLTDHITPFHRCIKCNGLLSRVDKATIIDQIPPDSAATYEVFHQCADCGQIYWKGSHFERMQAFLAELLA
jgi:uncharacterized protein